MSSNIAPLHTSDPLDQARAERDAAIAEFGYTNERLADRLLELRDPRALELFDQVLVSIGAVVEKSESAWIAFMQSAERIHDAELQVLGTNRQEAAGKLLAAMNKTGDAATGGIWPNS